MNDNVTLIPARRRAGNRISKEENKPKLKVAAYCRVSTDSDEQAGSYEVQVQHYTEYIGRNKDWELAGIYADDGISGTNTKKREGFNEMIDDCMAGKVDMIITKSISRFARNTIDCLKYVRQLKEKNIVIIFEKENINTLEASGELLLTIMASLAQQESASLSQNVKLGLQFRYQEGKVQVNHEHFLGYTKDEEGNLIIDEEEAKTIRRIYREYLEGASFRDIADGLERDKIKTGGKRYKWHLSTIRGILRNEKYMGDALLQKTITTDFIEKIRIKNDGTVPQYYVKDSQEPIMSIILGLFVFLMGRPWPTILIAVGAGLVTDFLLKSKEYKSIKLAVIGSGIFSVWMMGMILPLFFGYRTGYLESIRAGYGDAYVETISSITPDWMFFVLFALCILGGILGGLLGAKVLKKHFKKAGMA